MLNGTVRVPVPAVDTSQCAFARFAAEGDSPHSIHNCEEWAAYSAVAAAGPVLYRSTCDQTALSVFLPSQY